jgi:diaminopimelate epimerase
MPSIKFSKYQGAGNDFIIIDNRDEKITLTAKQIESLCDRRFGIGADGLMFLEHAKDHDFKMVYFNSDGNESTMCGNGGRCLIKFAQQVGVISNSCHFVAIDGDHDGQILSNGLVELKMTNTALPTVKDNEQFLDTGSPHVVVLKEDISKMDLVEEARKIRYGDFFKDEGTNVNFIQLKSDHIAIRTYERGVEDETLACGTGVTAAAIVANHQGWIKDSQVKVNALGGNLAVSFDKQKDGFIDVYLTGPAEFVFNGEIDV